MSKPRLGLKAVFAIALLTLFAVAVVYQFDSLAQERALSVGDVVVEPELEAYIPPSAPLPLPARIRAPKDEPASVAKQEIEYLLANPDELERRRNDGSILPKTAAELVEHLSEPLARGEYVSPCADGCDNVTYPAPNGTDYGLVPWRDKSYRTTRTNLRYRFVHPDIARVRPNTECTELVEVETQAEYPQRGIYRNDAGWIRRLGRDSTPAPAWGYPRSPIHRASKLIRVPCQ